MNENFISSTIKIFSSNAEGILNLFKERLSVQNDNFKDQKNFGKLINDNIAAKVRMNIKSDDWLKGNNNPDWCIVSEIHLDLNQIDLMSADNKYSFNNMAPCLTALLYIYHECNLKDEKMQIETRSQDNNLILLKQSLLQEKYFMAHLCPLLKKHGGIVLLEKTGKATHFRVKKKKTWYEKHSWRINTTYSKYFF